MGTALIPVQGYDVANQQMFDDIAKSVTTFLPRLQLLTGQSGLVKERKFPADHYGLFRRKDFVEDLGPRVDCIPVTVRAKAIRGLLDDEQQTYYDNNHPEFAKIIAESQEKDSGAMYGPEFLVWIPAIRGFAQFFCGSKSARLESQVLFDILKKGKAATLDSRVIKTKSYTWVTNAISICSTPFNPDELPEGLKVQEEVKRFMEAKSSDLVSSDVTNERAR